MTPRSDAEQFTAYKQYGEVCKVVPYDFACELEEELNALRPKPDLMGEEC